MGIDGAEEIVQETDAVEALDFYAGAGGVEIIADEGPDGHGDAVIGAGLEVVYLALEEFLGVVGFRDEDGLEGLEKALASGSGGDGLEIRGADAEEIDDDTIGAGEEICREDVDLLGSEGAAYFLQQQWPIPSGEDELGVALVWVIDPLDAGGELVCGFFFPLEEVAYGADLGDDMAGLAEVKGGSGHALEVELDVCVVILTHASGDFITQGDAVCIELLGVFFPASSEEIFRRLVELEHQTFFPASPAFGRGAIGIGEGE